MPPIVACADPALIQVTKSIVGDPLVGGGNVQTATLEDGDAVSFVIAVKNIGGETIVVDVVDTFDAVFTDVTWTRTPPVGAPVAGTGNINSVGVSLTAGQQISWLVEATYTPELCTSLTVNLVTVTLPDEACCGENERYAWAKVFNGTVGAPAVKLDGTEGFTSMEALYYLIENANLPDKVAIAAFVNACGSLADLLGTGGGGLGDGPATELLDGFGVGTGLFAETTVGF